MIHGNQVSIGCLAIGDSAIEELFVLAAITEWQQWRVLLSPTDLRLNPRPVDVEVPAWTRDLDEDLLADLKLLP